MSLLSFPIIFIGILKICIKYLPGEMIGSIDGWLGFLGGYFGVLGAVGAIWYQKILENKVAINSMELYSNYIVENLSNKLEKNLMPFLSVFSTLDGYDKLYEIEEINKRKKDFQLINNDIITSNLPIILSSKKFIILLNLKEKLDSLNYYIMKLENDITKGNILTPLLNEISRFEKYFELKKELICLGYILFRLNISYYEKVITFEESKILPKYKDIIQEAIKSFNTESELNINILKYYEICIGNIAKNILLINQNIEIRKYYYFPYNLLNLISIMRNIYEDIEKLKSTKSE
ncbi:hypothetical protein [Fusobacterium sp.]|uniref:hypothetical protein n=1 Tax=Fusobacterium sp. TaxID=68766 RepID=UPI00261AD87F|nr:hypothetical protein [Fusobacterium sp.]